MLTHKFFLWVTIVSDIFSIASGVLCIPMPRVVNLRIL